MNSKNWELFDQQNPNIIVPDRNKNPKVGMVMVDGNYYHNPCTITLVHQGEKCLVTEHHPHGKTKDKYTSVASMRELIGGLANLPAYTAAIKHYIQTVAPRLYPTGSVTYRPADLSTWKKLNLCPKVEGKTLVWKAVSDELGGIYHGALGASYELNKHYDYPQAMAVAGPVGTRPFSHNSDHIIAILADEVLDCVQYTRKDGAFYVPKGKVIAVYSVEAVTTFRNKEVDMDLKLVGGRDALLLIGA